MLRRADLNIDSPALVESNINNSSYPQAYILLSTFNYKHGKVTGKERSKTYLK